MAAVFGKKGRMEVVVILVVIAVRVSNNVFCFLGLFFFCFVFFFSFLSFFFFCCCWLYFSSFFYFFPFHSSLIFYYYYYYYTTTTTTTTDVYLSCFFLAIWTAAAANIQLHEPGWQVGSDKSFAFLQNTTTIVISIITIYLFIYY